jgi:hypothetical protein
MKRVSQNGKKIMMIKLLSNQVLDGTTVRYQLIKPLQTLSEIKGNNNWRTRVDDFQTACFEFGQITIF